MNRINVILMFFVVGLSSAMLFQNCSEMKGSEPDLRSSNTNDPIDGNGFNDGDGDNNDTDVPDFVLNRVIPLDNKQNFGESNWSFGAGSEDVFYYETDYLATYESTLVKIESRGPSVYLVVTSDDCNGEKILINAELMTINNFFTNYIYPTEVKISAAGEETTPGCGFPRLIVDTSKSDENGTPYVDYEIFFAPRECTPENSLYVVQDPDSGNVDPEAARMDVEAFFKTQIDHVCGM